LHIIEDTVDIRNVPFGYGEDDDNPTIAEVTYEDDSIRILEEFKSKKWKKLENDPQMQTKGIERMVDFGSQKQDIISKEARSCSPEYLPETKLLKTSSGKQQNHYSVKSFPRTKKSNSNSSLARSKKNDSVDSPIRRTYDYEASPSVCYASPLRKQRHNSDTSPPRRQRHDSNASPPRRQSHDSDASPARRQRHDSDASPPRRQWHKSKASSPRRQRHDSDASPPRTQRLDSDASPSRTQRHDSDASPPRRQRHDSDPTPPRRQRHDSDASPPRRKRHDSDASPSRRQRHNSDASPPNRQRHDSDTSPSRRQRHDSNASHPRKKRHDSDVSPPRRERHDSDVSFPGRHRLDSDALSSRRQRHDSDALPIRKKKHEFDVYEDNPSQPKQSENHALSKKGLSRPERKMTTDEYLQARKRGKLKKDTPEEMMRKERERKLQLEAEERNKQWKHGIKQVQQYQQKMVDDVHEMGKAFARSADDTDLNNRLKEVVREEDPMLEYMTKKKEQPVTQSQNPLYKGPFPPNRLNIRPGYRWDGVDRSNGFEKQWFERQSNKRAHDEDAYKWSVSDM
ncbi:bud site selection protein, partial [Halocaridina rubra]